MVANNFLARTDTSAEGPSIEVPLPTQWVVMIVLLSLIPVYICIGAPLIWCACRHRRRRNRAEKLQYSKSRALKPGLLYKAWKNQRAQDVEREPGRQGFERAERERDVRVEPMSVFGLLSSSQSVVGQKAKARYTESTMPGSSSVGQSNEDGEGLVGGEAESGFLMEKPGRTATWGLDAPPAYSSITTNESVSHVDITRL